MKAEVWLSPHGNLILLDHIFANPFCPDVRYTIIFIDDSPFGDTQVNLRTAHYFLKMLGCEFLGEL